MEKTNPIKKIKGEMTMNDALKKFQKTVCPETSLDDPRITEILLQEISKLKQVGE